MSRVRGALHVSLLESWTVVLLQFGSSVVIARLLTPAEIRVFSIAVLVAGLAQTVRDFGVTQYLIREEHLTDGKIRSALAVSMGVACSFTGTLVCPTRSLCWRATSCSCRSVRS